MFATIETVLELTYNFMPLGLKSWRLKRDAVMSRTESKEWALWRRAEAHSAKAVVHHVSTKYSLLAMTNPP